MSSRKLKVGLASAVAGVALAGGALLMAAPWASAQTPPTQPTPQQQQQGTPPAHGTPRSGTPGQQGEQPGPRGQGQHGDADCPKDEQGNMQRPGGAPGGQNQQGSSTRGGTSFGGGGRTLRQ